MLSCKPFELKFRLNNCSGTRRQLRARRQMLSRLGESCVQRAYYPKSCFISAAEQERIWN